MGKRLDGAPGEFTPVDADATRLRLAELWAQADIACTDADGPGLRLCVEEALGLVPDDCCDYLNEIFEIAATQPDLAVVGWRYFRTHGGARHAAVSSSAIRPATPSTLSLTTLQTRRYATVVLSADLASAAADAEQLAAAILQLIPLAPDDLAVELVAVAKLAALDAALAFESWTALREQLRRRELR